MTVSIGSGVTSGPPIEGLEVRDLRVAYGGNVAVDGVALVAPLRQITGLIGPNGAGKTTLFNAANGLLKPTDGQIALFGESVTSLSPTVRARRGLGRTFQHIEVCKAMTVAQNVSLGAEARAIAANPLRQLRLPIRVRRSIEQSTEDALSTCGLGDLAFRLVSTLSTGQRRLVELARALAGGYRLLLLDEPSSGLDDDETQRFGVILRSLVSEQDLGILLVEHDMSLVLDVCDFIFVLDFGRIVFKGDPHAVRSSEVVRAAYLGDEWSDGAET
jgi:ABC-type branched-subunit amino acid transport system ATPase component